MENWHLTSKNRKIEMKPIEPSTTVLFEFPSILTDPHSTQSLRENYFCNGFYFLRFGYTILEHLLKLENMNNSTAFPICSEYSLDEFYYQANKNMVCHFC
jgi:hypothetical protein